MQRHVLFITVIFIFSGERDEESNGEDLSVR